MTKGMSHSFIREESEEEEDCRAERAEEKVAEKVISRSEVDCRERKLGQVCSVPADARDSPVSL